MTRRFLAAVGASCIIAAAVPAAAAPLDVIGIAVGMPSARAIDLIKAHNPRMRIWPFRRQLDGIPPFVSAVKAEASNATADPDPDLRLELIFLEVMPTQEADAVIAVHRAVLYRQGKERPSAAVMAALEQKYGKHVLKLGRGTSIWHFDAAGKPVARETMCDSPGATVHARSSQISAAAAGVLINPQSLLHAERMAASCPAYVSLAIAHGPEKPDLVSRIDIVVADERLRAERYRALGEALRAAAEGKRQGEPGGKRAGDRF